jgi:integrase
LTLADAARIMRDAVKDRSYRATPLGLEVAKYYRWKKNEWGATKETLRDYEAILARLALYHADLELQDFAPPVGSDRLRDCWDHYWGDRAARTRSKVRSVWVDFFDWAVRERGLYGNPARALARPKERGKERGVFEAENVAKLISAQPRQRDRIALHLLFRLALRKGELAAVQFKHFKHDRKRLTVFGKGGTVAPVPIPDDLRLILADYAADERCEPGQFLLYPEKRGAGGKLLWEDRYARMSSTALHRWWHRCLVNAGLPPRPMHEARHTAITEFLRATGNLKLAQQLARHQSITTTADIYGHLDDHDLERALELLGPLE